MGDKTGARMVTIRVLLFATFAAPLLSQTKFADSKNNNKNVEISSLQEGFPTTPGPTEPAPTTHRNFINADVVMMCRLKGRIAKLNEISSNAFSLTDTKFT